MIIILKKKPKNTVHDKIVNSLEDRLRSNNHHILKEFEYKYNGDHEADLLVLNYKRKYAYAIEVKTTNHKKARRHARKQLKSDEAYINHRFNINRVFKFYAFKAKRKSKKIYEIKRVK